MSSVIAVIEYLSNSKLNLVIEPTIACRLESLCNKDRVRKCSGICGRSVDEAVVGFPVEAKAELYAQHSQERFQVVSRWHFCHGYSFPNDV